MTRRACRSIRTASGTGLRGSKRRRQTLGYYQAKGIKAAVVETSGTAWAVIGEPVRPQFA